ncbi:MAG: GAF domain-containing protein [Anaerolineae bacterium]|jgi:GAF domain-containing protein
MWQQIRRLLTVPTVEALAGGEEEAQRARLLRLLVSIHAALMFVMIFVSFATPAPLVAGSAVGSLLLVDILVLFLNRRGQVLLASTLFTAALWLVIAILTVVLGGVYGVAFSAYLVVVATAGFLLGGRGAAAIGVLSILASLGVAWAQDYNYLPLPLGESTPIFMWLSLSVYILIMVAIIHLATSSLYAALARARQSEQSLGSSYRQLEESRDALDAQTQILERRTAQLRAAAGLSRTVVSLLDMSELLWQAADLVGEQFDLYHVGIFQIDSTGRWAEYRAGAGQAGHLLAEQGFRLEVGGDSMVGWCTAQAQARIIQDVQGEDGDVKAGRVDHPLVPQTRSEAALPLLARGRVLGALSLQSDRPGAFDPDTVAVLQTIVDQIAVAMDNVRLIASSQQALEAARRAYGESTRQAWAEMLRGRGGWGYRFEGADVTPLEGKGPVETAGDRPVTEVDIPLKIRGEVVGVLNFQKDGNQSDRPDARAPGEAWTADEIRLLERMVEQMGLALESARLYQDTQSRATRERLIGEVATRMRESLEMGTLLRTAASEMRQALDLDDLVIRLTARGANGDPAQDAASIGVEREIDDADLD